MRGVVKAGFSRVRPRWQPYRWWLCPLALDGSLRGCYLGGREGPSPGPEESRPQGGLTMRNLLAFLAIAVLTVFLVGGWLGWYSIQTTRTKDGHQNINLQLDPAKIGSDLESGGERLQEYLEKSRKEQSVKHTEGDKL